MQIKRALVAAIAGALAAGALAGPAMASPGDGAGVISCRKAGEKPTEYLGTTEPESSIIGVL